MTTERDRIDQARANLLKMIRSIIRLAHSVAADNELNEALPKAERIFNAAVARGELPDPADVLQLLRGQRVGEAE